MDTQLRGPFKRVLLKLSGEALVGEGSFGIDMKVLSRIAAAIGEAKGLNLEIAVVIGGGNIFRGLAGAANGMDRATADYVGMLATLMNGIAVQDACEREGIHTRLMTAIEMAAVAEPYIRRRAIRHLEKGRVVIFGGGTGNPFFTTDTTAALRAAEIKADVVLKATKVDGIYDKDPVKHADAVKFDKLTYLDVLKKQLRVMDTTAISLCQENGVPIVVFNMSDPNNIIRVCRGEPLGTLVHN